MTGWDDCTHPTHTKYPSCTLDYTAHSTTDSGQDSGPQVMIVDAVYISPLNTEAACPEPSMNSIYFILYSLLDTLYTMMFTICGQSVCLGSINGGGSKL